MSGAAKDNGAAINGDGRDGENGLRDLARLQQSHALYTTEKPMVVKKSPDGAKDVVRTLSSQRIPVEADTRAFHLEAVKLSNDSIERVRRDEKKMTTLLPDAAIRVCYAALENMRGTTALGGDAVAAEISFRGAETIYFTPYLLIHMTAVHGYNARIIQAWSAWTWLGMLASLEERCPYGIGELISLPVSVPQAAKSVQNYLGKSRPSQTAWYFFDSSSGVDGLRAAQRTYAGITVTCAEMVSRASTAWMTSGVINAALFELGMLVQSRRKYVLLVEQASSFHSNGARLVPEDAALTAEKVVAAEVGD